MIVYPKYWDKDYSPVLIDPVIYVDALRDFLKINIEEMDIIHLAYSGGIDSTIMLAELTEYYGKGVIHTYTIASRENHPDVLFARKGAKHYDSIHHEFIVEPEDLSIDDQPGDNAVRQFFNIVSDYTFEIICCDGIDEYMCGYYDHMAEPDYYYSHYLSRLNPDHLQPLHKNSGSVFVYLPYLEGHFVGVMQEIDINDKVSNKERKKIMILWAKKLNIPEEIIDRNKYGFVDAFIKDDK
jgi:asparagine synthetase B (glutamine-hydrolysing)